MAKQSKAWKKFEASVAAFFGVPKRYNETGRCVSSGRTPLSGGNSAHTRSDTLHKRLYVECKWSQRIANIRLWDDTKEKAKREKKIPVVALTEKYRPGFWLLVHSDDFLSVAKEIENEGDKNDKIPMCEPKLRTRKRRQTRIP